jgi:hypothetical protein
VGCLLPAYLAALRLFAQSVLKELARGGGGCECRSLFNILTLLSSDEEQPVPPAAKRARTGDGSIATSPRAASPAPSCAASVVGDANVSLGGAESSLGAANVSLGDAKSSLGDAESSLRDAESSLGDAESSLVDA